VKQVTMSLVVMITMLCLACSEPSADSIAQENTSAKKKYVTTTNLPKPIREDWPAFLGPHQNSISRETGLLLEWPADGPKVVWKKEIGVSFGAPVVGDGKLIVFHRIADEEVIECVDALDGNKTFWKHSYPTSYRDRYNYNGGPRSSATIHGEHVYAFGAEGVLTCVEFETGKRVWQRQVSKDFDVPQGFFGVGTAPVIDGELILLNVGGPNGAGIVAFNKTSGETAWKTGDDTASYSTPIVATVNGERLAIFYTGDGLYVVDAKSGEKKYSYPFRSRIRESAIAASPLLVDDVVFLSATYQIGAVALRLTPNGLEEVWKELNSLQTHWATAIYHEGNLYGVHGRHEGSTRFRCIDFGTAEIVWTAPDDYSRDPKKPRQRLGRAGYVMAENHLITMGENGDLALIELSTEGYKEKARAWYLRGPVYTPPILAQGYVYIRNETELICLDLRATQD